MEHSSPPGATVVKLSVPRRYRAWCEECQDGYQGGKPTTMKWVDKHNREKHPEDPQEVPEDPQEVPC